MDYGQIFVGTFKTIWRHKRLWLFGLLGTLLAAIGSAIYLGVALNWQSNWFNMLNNAIQQPGRPGFERFPGQFMSSLVGLVVGVAVMILAALLGYIVNLVMRSATISEAAIAWRGGQTETGRGLRVGAERAIYVFVLDLLWWVPIWIIVVAGYLAGIVGMVGITSVTGESEGGAGAVMLTLCAWICGLLCLGLLIAVVYGVFAPLMYQSAVQGRRELGQAIREGWRLARANLGAMIIFWLLLIVLAIAVNLILQVITLPLTLPWLTSWLAIWARWMERAMSGLPPTLPRLNAGQLALAGLGTGIASWLYSSFMQTFKLTMYAEVYRRLAGAAAPAVAALPPVPPAPPDLGLTVPEESPVPADENKPYV
jgi:hypothetical protein